MGDDRDDQFDDLFEPFELSDVPETAPPSTTPAPPPPPSSAATTHDQRAPGQTHVTTEHATVDSVSCPACGAQNPSFNHHCERCGSRLSTSPMPIAPAPASRTSPGVRALGVLAAVVLIVILVALMVNIFRGGEPAQEGADTSSSTTTTQPEIVTEIFPTSATASSSLDGFGPENLIDGNPDTRWNDASLRGVDAWLEFTFATPVQIKEMEFQNVTDDTKFHQNFKIKGYSITVNDLNVPIVGRLLNSNAPQTVRIASLDTVKLRVAVSTTYLAESVDDNPPFDELALQGVKFFGVEK